MGEGMEHWSEKALGTEHPAVLKDGAGAAQAEAGVLRGPEAGAVSEAADSLHSEGGRRSPSRKRALPMCPSHSLALSAALHVARPDWYRMN